MQNQHSRCAVGGYELPVRLCHFGWHCLWFSDGDSRCYLGAGGGYGSSQLRDRYRLVCGGDLAWLQELHVLIFTGQGQHYLVRHRSDLHIHSPRCRTQLAFDCILADSSISILEVRHFCATDTTYGHDGCILVPDDSVECMDCQCAYSSRHLRVRHHQGLQGQLLQQQLVRRYSIWRPGCKQRLQYVSNMQPQAGSIVKHPSASSFENVPG
mmetsp:Transcript_20242/g.46513  ORF Transcript_20242/g.46513 Transcript_20242/m.46513 type:complete len:211 (-) Transcript_20242:182-814(-)